MQTIKVLTAVSLLGTALAIAPAQAQYLPPYPYRGPAVTSAQQMLLFNRNLSSRDFQRYMYALPTLNQTQFRQQQLYRERMARQQALAEQRRIQSTLNRGSTGRFITVPVPTQQAQNPPEPQVPPELIAVWKAFGVLLRPADPQVVQKSAPAYRTGMEIVGLQNGGPAARAGWKEGDILLGLDKFRTEETGHVAYVAQTPSVLQGQPLDALILRQGTVYSSTIDPSASLLPPVETPERDASSASIRE